VTRDPFGVARGGGFDRGVLESAQNWLLFHTIFTLKDCLAGSTLHSSATLRGEHKGNTPRGAPKLVFGADQFTTPHMNFPDPPPKKSP